MNGIIWRNYFRNLHIGCTNNITLAEHEVSTPLTSKPAIAHGPESILSTTYLHKNLLNIYLTSFLSSHSSSFMWTFSDRFPHQHFVCIPCIPHPGL